MCSITEIPEWRLPLSFIFQYNFLEVGCERWYLFCLFFSFFPEFVAVEEWLLDSQALWGLRSPVGEILSTSKEKQYLLLQQEQALHCYGYRIHVFWIFLLFKSFEKISQTRVCKLLLVPTFPLGAEFAGFSGFLDSLSQSPWGAASTGVSVHWCMRSWAFRTF